jgi:hypothetical protein
MNWSSPFIVYRVSADGKLQEVFHAQDLKKAKYWLTYIAHPGDVLCQTPAHPKNPGDEPKYWSHKHQSGTSSSDQKNWEQFAKKQQWQQSWPKEQSVFEVDGEAS